MAYSVINNQIYTAAYSGAMSGIVRSIAAQPLVSGSTPYNNVVAVAQSYAQAFDTLWAARSAFLVDIDIIFAQSFAYFLSYPPADLHANPALWTQVAATTINVVTSVEADYAAQGVALLAIPTGGGSTPTGTGIPHIVAGVQNGAASLIVDADVAAAAAIAVTKLAIGGTGLLHVVAGVPSSPATLIVDSDIAAGATIQASKVVQATGTGLVKVVGGGLVALSALLVDADVNAAAAIAGTKISPNFGAQGIVTTGTLNVGPTVVATSGAINVGGGAGLVTQFAWFDTAANRTIVRTIGARILFGDDGINTEIRGSVFLMQAAGSNALVISGGFVNITIPVVGNVADTSPYSVHGGISIALAAAPGTVVLTAAQYSNDHLEFTGATTAFAIQLPLPASVALGYYKTITNATTVSMTIQCSSGTTKVLTTNLSARVWVDSAGVQFASSTFTR